MYYIQIKKQKDGDSPEHDKNYCCLRYFYYPSNKEGGKDTIELVEMPITSKNAPVTVVIKIDRLKDAVFVMNINGKTIRTIPQVIG